MAKVKVRLSETEINEIMAEMQETLRNARSGSKFTIAGHLVRVDRTISQWSKPCRNCIFDRALEQCEYMHTCCAHTRPDHKSVVFNVMDNKK